MEMLSALEQSAFAAWLRESNTIWAYPTVLTLHTIGLALLVGANAVLDLRLLGFGRELQLIDLRKSFRVMWIGFWINALSGGLLFAADATTKGTTTVFMWKLAFVALGVVNILLIELVVYGRREDVPRVTGIARLLAATSLTIWVAAIAAGRFMAYV